MAKAPAKTAAAMRGGKKKAPGTIKSRLPDVPTPSEYLDKVKETYAPAMRRYRHFLMLKPSVQQRRQYNDPDLVDGLCDLLRKSVPLKYACTVLGIHEHTIMGWRKNDYMQLTEGQLRLYLEAVEGVEIKQLPSGGVSIEADGKTTQATVAHLYEEALNCLSPQEMLVVQAQAAIVSQAQLPSKRLEEADAEGVALNLMTIQSAGPKYWQAAAWLLERMHPVDFSLNSPKKKGRSDGQPVIVYVKTVVPRNERTMRSRTALMTGKQGLGKHELPDALERGPVEVITEVTTEDDEGQVIEIEARPVVIEDEATVEFEEDTAPKVRRRGE